jgi:hypothetical protein
LSYRTGFHNFMPSEAGYDELRRLFDYLKQEGVIGQQTQTQQENGETANGTSNGVNGHHDGEGIKITVVDADDLLDKPAEVVRAFCEDVGIDYHDGMLKWEDEEGQKRAVEAFKKWDGFHDDAIASTELRARLHPKVSFHCLFHLCVIGGSMTADCRRKHLLRRKRTRRGG